MPIHFIDNYPKNDLESKICKANGTPLHGEIWVYNEFQKFNDHDLVKDETWYVKHNYNLSLHPASSGKVEGQIDYLVLNRFGILIIEVKGGGIEVDENDSYFSYDRKSKDRYETQNPFNQAKEYVHSLKSLIDSNPFIYRCVIFPHEAGFELVGPQLSGYKYLFFSKRDLDSKETDYAKNQLFYDFLCKLSKDARKTVVDQLTPAAQKHLVAKKMWTGFPEMDRKAIQRLKNELFPVQTTYGFDPDRIKNEVLLEENYEVLKGLRKNSRVMVQGAPGTGKTVLARKFLAENILKQHKGIFFCANRLLRSKMEYLMYEEYKLDPNLITFKIYYQEMKPDDVDESIDFVIVDEAQEFFDKGLFEFIETIENRLSSPKVLLLYDPEQTITRDYKEIDWYADYFVKAGYVHFLFDTVWRCAQNKEISEIANFLKTGTYKKLSGDPKLCSSLSSDIDKLKALKEILDKVKTDHHKNVILIESSILDQFKSFVGNYFKQELEELTDININIKCQKIRYTTPIKFRGLEAENVTMITPGFNDSTRTQNFIGATRAIYDLKFLLWI
jgi:hypothetical protein